MGLLSHYIKVQSWLEEEFCKSYKFSLMHWNANIKILQKPVCVFTVLPDLLGRIRYACFIIIFPHLHGKRNYCFSSQEESVAKKGRATTTSRHGCPLPMVLYFIESPTQQIITPLKHKFYFHPGPSKPNAGANNSSEYWSIYCSLFAKSDQLIHLARPGQIIKRPITLYE